MEPAVKRMKALLEQEQSGNSAGNSSFENLSPIERLADNLVWKIVDSAPETVFNLRLVNRLMRFRVDEYVLKQGTMIPLVDQVHTSPSRSFTELSVCIPKEKSAVFELRLKDRMGQIVDEHRIKRRINENGCMCYDFSFNPLADNPRILEYISCCFGRHIKQLNFVGNDSEVYLGEVSKVVDGIRVNTLLIRLGTITPNLKAYILKFLDKLHVNKLSLTCTNFTTDPPQFLLELSSIVKSLHIKSEYALDADWSSIIPEMFSRKLSDFEIAFKHHSECISKSCVDALIEILPTIGKKISFKSTCARFEEDFSFMRNDYMVKVLAQPRFTDNGSLLSIKHVTRKSGHCTTDIRTNLIKCIAVRPKIMENLSLFERLPIELAWKIFEFVPESVLVLRLTSSHIKSQIDEFVRNQSSISNLEYVHFECFYSNLLIITLEISLETSVFRLRLALRQYESDLESRIKCNFKRRDAKEYAMRFDTHIDDMRIMEDFADLLGKRIPQAMFKNCYENHTLSATSTALKGVQCEKMSYDVDILTDERVTFLMDAIVTHGIEELGLRVRKVQSSNPVKTLIDLSSVVGSMGIDLCRICDPYSQTPIFFGLQNADWASIILQMFTNKLNKLCIRSWSELYMNSKSVDCLREALPNIGKNIWFDATCAETDEYRYMKNNHIVEVVISRQVHHLRVIHSSRENETFNF